MPHAEEYSTDESIEHFAWLIAHGVSRCLVRTDE